MTTTGYSDTFGRTVANGLGVASSGQTYTLMGVATQFQVAPNTASILPSSTGDKAGYIDLQSSDFDVTAQVALSAIPVTNLATVGFFGKLANASNYYNATMMVAVGGAISLRFSRVLAGSLTTLSTTATGLTYVANAVYNLRYSIRWSQTLQTNVMQLMLWAVGSNPPGGWMATTFNADLTQYTSGTQVGIMARDESTVLGAVTAKIQNVLVRSFNLPSPAASDPMCQDPAVAFPDQTVVQSIAQAADVAMVALDPLAAIAQAFPRVRLSNALMPINTATFGLVPFTTVEYNVGTPTNLGLDSFGAYLPVGVWLVTFEIQLKEATSDWLEPTLSGFGDTIAGISETVMRSYAVQPNDNGVGGCGRVSKLVISTDPTTPVRMLASLFANNPATTYTATYCALSAIKISDYFA